MELHEIRYFLALSQTLNFTRAADICNVTQPALTRAIRSLEDKLGGTLVNRERGNTHLTELGRMMQPYFDEMLGHLQEAKQHADRFIRLDRARLAVGLMCTIGPQRLIDLFRDFNRQYEGVELFLKDGAAHQLEDLLTRGEIDVAIYCKPEAPSEALHSLPLYHERFVIAVSENHRLAQLPKIRAEDLNGQRYLWRMNCEYADHIDDAYSKLGIQLDTPYISERDDWIQCMVLAGLGFTMIPEFAVTVPGLITRALVEPEFVRSVNLATVRGRPHSPAVGAFVHACRTYPWTRQLAGARRAEAVH